MVFLARCLSESRFRGPGLEWSYYLGVGSGGLVAGGLWAGLRPIACSEGLYEEALAGGRHAGFLDNYAARSTREIEKAIRSLEKQISTHLEKIANPRSSIRDWDALDPRHQEDLLMNKWPSDIARQLELIEILRGILRSRQ